MPNPTSKVILNNPTKIQLAKLVPQIKVTVRNEPKRYGNPEGPLGRLKSLRAVVAAVVHHERIELNFVKATETRPYIERLISDAMRYGDCHKSTMELATFWLETDKRLIHKLFKVLVPRFKDCTTCYTNIHILPNNYVELLKNTSNAGQYAQYMQACLELKGNQFPPIRKEEVDNRKWLHNVLLSEARREYRMKKYREAVEKFASEDPETAAVAGVIDEATVDDSDRKD